MSFCLCILHCYRIQCVFFHFCMSFTFLCRSIGGPRCSWSLHHPLGRLRCRIIRRTCYAHEAHQWPSVWMGPLGHNTGETANGPKAPKPAVAHALGSLGFQMAKQCPVGDQKGSLARWSGVWLWLACHFTIWGSDGLRKSTWNLADNIDILSGSQQLLQTSICPRHRVCVLPWACQLRLPELQPDIAKIASKCCKVRLSCLSFTRIFGPICWATDWFQGARKARLDTGRRRKRWRPSLGRWRLSKSEWFCLRWIHFSSVFINFNDFAEPCSALIMQKQLLVDFHVCEINDAARKTPCHGGVNKLGDVLNDTSICWWTLDQFRSLPLTTKSPYLIIPFVSICRYIHLLCRQIIEGGIMGHPQTWYIVYGSEY